MPEPAKTITIDLRDRTLLVDGRPFPWAITPDGPSIGGVRHQLRQVTVTILTRNVELIPENAQETSHA
ncbi:hypothetical protein [Nocardia cyriacigeorgica]|uniref:hypothetical protein n=1 Tax=Nocardia cyriacigeorgica TaxID=135487 RepID=UPI00245409A1|nr:hypothetical protein [Nocardia cyriacigeorgica]